MDLFLSLVRTEQLQIEHIQPATEKLTLGFYGIKSFQLMKLWNDDRRNK